MPDPCLYNLHRLYKNTVREIVYKIHPPHPNLMRGGGGAGGGGGGMDVADSFVNML